MRRGRLVLAWIVGLYLARMYVTMGWVKFDPHGFWTAAFQRWGYPAWFRVLVGVIEVVGGATLVIPWLASYGALAVAGVMVGAWWTRFHDHRYVDVAWISAYALALAWLSYEWWGRRWGARKKPSVGSGGP